MEQKVISVIIPVYNAEKFIGETISSILNQNYTKIELIIIDDGSTDGSEKKILDFHDKDSRLVYIKQTNQGPSAARNNGLNKASGDLILFVDADDSLKENAIQNMVNESNGSDLLIFGYENINEEKSEKNQVVLPSIKGTYFLTNCLQSFGELLEKNVLHYIWHKLYTKESVKGVRFDETVKVGEDLLFNIEVLRNVSQLTFTDSVYYNHIWYNQDSITRKYHENLFYYRSKQFHSAKRFLEYHHEYTDSNKIKVKKYFLKKYIACFINMESPEASLSRNDKRKKIKMIISESNIEKLVEHYDDQPSWQRMYIFMMRHELIFGVEVLTKILQPLQTLKRG